MHNIIIDEEKKLSEDAEDEKDDNLSVGSNEKNEAEDMLNQEVDEGVPLAFKPGEIEM